MSDVTFKTDNFICMNDHSSFSSPNCLNPSLPLSRLFSSPPTSFFFFFTFSVFFPLSLSFPAGLKTQVCSPIRRAFLFGLWCWVTPRDRAQRLPTGWGHSVVTEIVSPARFSSCLVTHQMKKIFPLWKLLLLHD